jgi:hypothetical protein
VPGRLGDLPTAVSRVRSLTQAEVDFGEFYATITGKQVKVWIFVMPMLHSGRAFHVAYGTQAQEAFLEGHVLAFRHFCGVPGRVRYDNLKPAVTRILKDRDRDEAERFVAMRSHCGQGPLIIPVTSSENGQSVTSERPTEHADARHLEQSCARWLVFSTSNCALREFT